MLLGLRAQCRNCGATVRRSTESCSRCGAAWPIKPAKEMLDGPAGAKSAGAVAKLQGLAGLLLLVGIGFGVYSWASQPPTVEEQAKIDSERQIAKSAVDTAVITSRRPEWDEVVVRDARRNAFDLVLYYRYWPAGFSVVERDTKELIRALLHELRLQWPPVKRDSLRIHVFAKIYQRGETGKLLIRDVGTTSYLGTEDLIRYERPK